jgi:hypothetical protein
MFLSKKRMRFPPPPPLLRTSVEYNARKKAIPSSVLYVPSGFLYSLSGVILKVKVVVKLASSAVAASHNDTGLAYNTRHWLPLVSLEMPFLVSSIIRLVKDALPQHSRYLL